MESGSCPPELAVELVTGEGQGGRSAVGAVVGVGDEVAVTDEGIDLKLRERVPRLDRRFAGRGRRVGPGL
jgi:hypothetical protein